MKAVDPSRKMKMWSDDNYTKGEANFMLESGTCKSKADVEALARAEISSCVDEQERESVIAMKNDMLDNFGAISYGR